MCICIEPFNTHANRTVTTVSNNTQFYIYLINFCALLRFSRAARRAGLSGKTQASIAATFQQQFSNNSVKYKGITKEIGVFIAKDMQPYSTYTHCIYVCVCLCVGLTY